MILKWIKSAGSYLWAILLGLVGILTSLLIASNESRKRWKERSKRSERENERRRDAAERDNEIEGQTRSRRADIRNELKDTGGSSTFRDPNKLFDDDPG